MRQATLVWSLWQRLLQPFASAFTRPGHRRFVEWVTALALNVEEHTITQSVTAIERVADWKALESFAEYAVWKPEGPHQQPFANSSTTLLAASGMATGSRPSMTPRFIDPVSMSGGPAPPTNTPLAVPIGPLPCGRTTGSASGALL